MKMIDAGASDAQPPVEEESGDNNVFLDMPWWGWLLVANALVGLVFFELAYHHTRRFRSPNLDLEELYPAYRRRDARNWSKLKFYPGAVTIFIPRFLLMVVFLLCGLIIMNLLMLGHGSAEVPITGCRNKCLRFWYNLGVRAIGLFAFFFTSSCEYISEARVNHYEEYLGTLEEQVEE